jgi:ribose 5-phosphate isomerase A
VSADDQKKAAAEAALKFIEPGMKVGLGTGSTANHFTRALAAKVKKGLDVTCVPTSRATYELAKSLGLKLTTLEADPRLHYTVDGADEFDPQFRLIKGGGGALLIEKIVATSSRIMVTIVDESKKVQKLGKFPLPVEVIPFGVRATAWKMEMAFEKLKIKPKMTVRSKDGKTFRTESGNAIIDCACGEINDPDRLDVMLNNIPGVVNNGLFVGISGVILMGTDKGVQEFVRA